MTNELNRVVRKLVSTCGCKVIHYADGAVLKTTCAEHTKQSDMKKEMNKK